MIYSNKKALRIAVLIFAALMLVMAFSAPVLADSAAEEASSSSLMGSKAIASAIAIGLAALGGAIGMGIASGKAAEGISRQPEAESKIRTAFMLGVVFVETAIIYALLVVILIIFVL